MALDLTAPLDRLGSSTCARLRAIARAAEGRAWLVGGAVRDLLLDRPWGDLDIVVEGDAATVASRLGWTVVSRSQFLTVVVRPEPGIEWDLVTARRETYDQPAALPTVTPSSIDDDLARRDFAVNAMAAGLAEDTWGALLDPHGGRDDLAAGRLRVLHEQSFIDDPTRLFRLWRYAVRLDFKPDRTQRDLYHLALRAGVLGRLSGERLRAEFEHALAGDDWDAQLLKLWHVGLLQSVIPEAVYPGGRMNQLRSTRQAWEAAGLPWPEAPWLVRFDLALRTQRQQRARVVAEVTRRLALSEAHRCILGTEWPVSTSFPRQPSAVAQRLDGLNDAQLVLLACHAPTLLDTVVTYRRDHQSVRPKLDGDDLLALGLRPGPAVGRVLAELRAARLDGEVVDDTGERALAAALVARELDA